MRRNAPADPGTHVEAVGPIVRIVGPENTIVYSELDERRAAEVVAEETREFRSLGRKVEWKVYGHDRPGELGELLSAAGWSPAPVETLMVLDLARGLREAPAPPDLAVRRVLDPDDLRRAAAVAREAFGPDETWGEGEYLDRLSDPGFAMFLAELDGVPVAVGRLEMPEGRSFASLWGGGTAPAARGRGCYRRLVSARAELARSRGYRYLTVDARETSRPILERIGFRPLTSLRGWLLDPEAA